MTEHLYYGDSYCAHFSARVIEQLTWEERPAVVLDQTAFYPTSGGQPADWGTLGGIAVIDVAVRELDGAIVHILAHDLVDVEVDGKIDWPRRFDHMQQHTGQHILSAAFEQLLDADTVGFHLGAEMCTIDLSVARLEPAAVIPVEELVNQVVWENRLVDTRFISPDDLAALSLRRSPTVVGPIRIVDIADFDVNPCGGTHVTRTGEIGLIKIVRLEYRGDETRVEFLCGKRALYDYRSRNQMIGQLTDRLTVGYWELDQAVERLQIEGKRLRKNLRRARKRLLKTEASELAETAIALADESGPRRVVCKIWERTDEKSPEDLRDLAQGLVQHQDVLAILAGVGEERTHLIFAKGSEIDLDVATLFRDACTQLGGKGGGRPNWAQGSAPVTDVVRVRTVLADALSSLGVSVF
ncbi:MAG: alanyl-tRNA editing protein [Chloroflexi bacterium]|nr:alanyl-tRNA editing protein [Chloroflexota bacterium]